MRKLVLIAAALAAAPAQAHAVLFPHVHVPGMAPFDIETDVACSMLFGLLLGSALTLAVKAILRRMGRQ